MTREIKFRVWDSTTKQMGTGGIHLGNGYISPIRDSDVLMQYTGLKDKNGKEIYEGDILSVNYEIVTSRYEVIIDKGHTIVKHPEYKVGERPLMFYLSDDNTQLYEVIGNIYESPKLLEKTDDKE